MSDQPVFFAGPAEFRAWLDRHHQDERELWVGFYKKGSGRAGIAYREAVDEALCFGWIDGLTRRVDEDSYTVRFTPRRPSSVWSAINIRRIEQLRREGRLRPAGLAAYERRDVQRSEIYSHERDDPRRLGPEQEARLRADPAAWEFFQAQPPSYRKLAIWWVVSAKKEETRRRRLDRLIEDSANGRRITAAGQPRPRPPRPRPG